MKIKTLKTKSNKFCKPSWTTTSLIALLFFQCAVAPPIEQLHKPETSLHLESDPFAETSPLDLNVVSETIDAIQAELITTGYCKGGESIEIWLRPSSEVAGVIDCVYFIPLVLDVYRLAYLERDGLVILDSDLSYSKLQLRYSIHKTDSRHIVERHLYPTLIFAKLATSLTETQIEKQKDRERRKREWINQP